MILISRFSKFETENIKYCIIFNLKVYLEFNEFKLKHT